MKIGTKLLNSILIVLLFIVILDYLIHIHLYGLNHSIICQILSF